MSTQRKYVPIDEKKYIQQLETFRDLVETQMNTRRKRLMPKYEGIKVWVTHDGYKFNKVYTCDFADQVQGYYMVERITGNIYGIKSWTQVNLRRWFGTLDTIDQYDWSDEYARALPGTEAERKHIQRETEIVTGYKRRGRRPRSAVLVGVGIPDDIFKR